MPSVLTHRFELGKRKACRLVPRLCVRAATSNRQNLPRIASFRAQPPSARGAAARPADARNNAAEPPPRMGRCSRAQPAARTHGSRSPPCGRTGCRIPPNVRPPHPAPAHLRAGSSCRAFSTCFAAASSDRVKITSCCCAAALLAQTAHAGARIIRGARRPSGRRGIMRHAAPRTKEAPCQREPTRSPLRSTT